MAQTMSSDVVFEKTLGHRKTFKAWQIPIDVRTAYAIKDGDVFDTRLSVSDREFDLTLRVTSGGEIALPAKIAGVVAQLAQHAPDGTICFRLRQVGFLDQKQPRATFLQAVTSALNDSPEERLARLSKSSGKVEVREVTAIVYVRNPDVVAEALFRANGKCKRCDKPAPFTRKSDGSPYLEVHHVRPLGEGGTDDLDNVEALCPNCHRAAHFG